MVLVWYSLVSICFCDCFVLFCLGIVLFGLFLVCVIRLRTGCCLA